MIKVSSDQWSKGDLLHKHISFRTKLLVLCFVLSGLSVGTALLCARGLSHVSNSYEEVTSKALPNIEKLNDMFLAYRAIRINLRSLGLPGLSPAQQDDFVTQTKTHIAEYETLEAAYRAVPHSPEEAALFEPVQAAWRHFRSIGERVLKLQADGGDKARHELIQILLVDCPAAAKTYTAAVTELKEHHLRFGALTSANAKQDAQSTGRFMLILSVCSLLGGLVVGYAFAAQVNAQISKTAKRLAEAAGQIATSSRHVSESSQTLSSAAAEQAASLQQTAASLEEITAMVTKTSGHASTTSGSSDSSREKAEEGRRAVERVVSSMGEIRESNDAIVSQVENSREQMGEIVAIIRSIEEKTAIIDDLVFQTKLLSFNASVEAARAGEHGAGFSVVADEIGQLARNSGEAARAIGELLNVSTTKVESIANDTRSKVASLVERGKSRVDSGHRTAQECADVLTAIVHDVSRVSDLAREISLASREQSQGIGEINRAITQLDAVTQQNAAASGVTASTAEELNAQVQTLEGCVADLFRVLNGSRAAA